MGRATVFFSLVLYPSLVACSVYDPPGASNLQYSPLPVVTMGLRTPSTWI